MLITRGGLVATSFVIALSLAVSPGARDVPSCRWIRNERWRSVARRVQGLVTVVMIPYWLTLRARMVLLVLAGVLPLLAFNLGSVYNGYREDQAQAGRQALDLARSLAFAVEGELDRHIAALQVLALSSSLATGDMATFRAKAEVVVARQLPGANIRLLREDGQQLMNTALPPDATLPIRRDLKNLRRIFATGLPSVSDLIFGLVVTSPVVAIEVPVLRADGSVRLVLAMCPPLSGFDTIIQRQNVGKGWHVSVLDRTGWRITRVPADGGTVRQTATPDFMRAWSGAFEGTLHVTSPDGVPVLAAFSHLPGFAWTVVVAVPAAELTESAWRSALMSLTVGLGLLALGLVIAHLVSRSVVGPVSTLRRLASAADGDGEPGAAATGLREADEVAEALLTEGRRRRAATTSLVVSEHRLQRVVDELNSQVHQLSQARDKAGQASQAKSRFLASMSHELRTPLNGILGYARMLQIEGQLNSSQEERVLAMLRTGQHLLGMINRVLAFSEIEIGQIKLHLAEINPKALAQACLDQVRPAAEAKGITLHLIAASNTPWCMAGDPTLLRQVLLNLLGNAVKFTAQGSVELRLQPAGTGRLRVEVADTGPGISAGERHRLFQDFERLGADDLAFEGAGLGLGISAQLVKTMGGDIGYEDNPGGGSLFWFNLPEGTAVGPVPVAPEQEPLPHPVCPLRILVVDDVAMNREIAQSFLSAAGHDVVCADGGAEAVAFAAAEDFDAVLMDVRMPKVDGLEATRRIRLLVGARGGVPIVALTAQAFAEQVTACHLAGMDCHLAKPFTQEDLLAIVGRAIAIRKDAGLAGLGTLEATAEYPSP